MILELWFGVEWDDEGTHSAVRKKWIVGNQDPCIGDHIDVIEGKRTFGGLVVRKGKYCAVC